MARPIVPLLIALLAGIAAGSMGGIPDQIILLCLALAIFLTLVSFRMNWSLCYHFFVYLSFFLVGFLGIGIHDSPPLAADHIRHLVGEVKLTGEGMICENPRISSDKTELVISLCRILRDGRYRPASGRLLLRVRDGSEWEYGDFVRFQARLKKPHNFQNPGGFDYERYLRRRGILVSASISEPYGIVLLRKAQGNPLRLQLEAIRSRIRKTLQDKVPEAEGRVIQAMILGEKKEIPGEIIESFNKTGTSHIIAISGLHVGIVAFVCLVTIRWLLGRSDYLLLRWNIAKIASFAAMIVVLCYMGIAGLGISVIRATIMVLTFMLAIMFDRYRDLYQAVALAAFLILIISPASLFDISFQLSFSAVLAIVFLTPRLVALLPGVTPSPPPGTSRETLWAFLKKSFRGGVILSLVSLSATLGTLPLILFYFNRLSIISPIANLVAVPILGLLATPLFLLTILVIPLSTTLTDLVLTLCVWLVGFSLWLINRLAALPFSAAFVTTPNFIEMTAYYLLLISLGFSLDVWCRPLQGLPAAKGRIRFWNWIALLLILFFFSSTLLHHLRSIQGTSLSLTALDVGQGSAILVRFPGGEKMMVDGGGFHDDSFDIGRSVLAPYLWKERIDRIETVVLTHPHPDHLQGLLFLLEHFRVREVWTNGDGSDSPLYQRFLQIVRSRGLTVQTFTDATPARDIAGVAVRFFNPRPPPGRGDSEGKSPLPSAASPSTIATLLDSSQDTDRQPVSEDANDRSLVIKLSYRDRHFLLPADITSVTEKRLLQTGADLKSDVLFVPHHGSVHSSSDSFIRRVSPLIGLASCGWENSHRFPHSEVVERYRRASVRLYRTDRDGAITVKTDGKELKVSTFRERRR